jgi:CubicO group peptidase (beta-lactamase class C family)
MVRALLVAVGVAALLATAIFAGDLVAAAIRIGPLYAWRLMSRGNASVEDYKYFPARDIASSPVPVRLAPAIDTALLDVAFSKLRPELTGTHSAVTAFAPFLEKNGTDAFIVLRDDRILYEGYFNGHRRDSIMTSFSTAKSVAALLVGVAIAEGRIRSVDQPVTDFVPELDSRLQSVTLRHLLEMSSGLRYRRNNAFGPLSLLWSDDVKAYYVPNLRRLALSVEPETVPGRRFQYNNFNPLLVGMVLERATGMSVSAYLESKLWRPLGTEFAASWSLDGTDDQFEKMESGINARSIDFAKLGLLVLHQGNWHGRQIVPASWVREMTAPPTSKASDYYTDGGVVLPEGQRFFQRAGGYYGRMWWGYTRPNEPPDTFALGNFGQVIYVSPSTNTVIIRNGSRWGAVPSWPALFQMFARTL